MALREDFGIKILTANVLGTSEKEGYTKDDLMGANEAIRRLAENPNPENRYQIGQIMAYSVQDILEAREAEWLNRIAEVQDIPAGAKAEFKVDLDNIEAFIQAKGATTPRSKMFRKYVPVDTVEVSARPYVNYMELAMGKVDFSKYLTAAANRMEAEKMAYIDSVLTAAAKLMPMNAYASGSGIVKATLDDLIIRMGRLGHVTLLGDAYMVNKVSQLAGFSSTVTAITASDQMKYDFHRNGYIGFYNGADVVKYTSPLKAGTLDPIINYKWLWLLVAGQESPLKVVNEGVVTSMDQTNIDDHSYEVCLRQNFGAGFVLGNVPTIGGYEDTSA